MSAYRPVDLDDVAGLRAAGKSVHWAEGVGYVVEDDQADRALKEQLEKLLPEPDEDEGPPADAYDRFGGNMDDAYNGGVEDGRQQVIAEIRKALGL